MIKTTAMWIWAMSEVMRTYALPREKLSGLINRRLHRVLVAANRTPYYRNVMQELDYNPVQDFRGSEDLKYFPILTKDIINEHGEKAFTSEDMDISRQFTDSTSGSTGLPLRIYRNPQARALQLAKWLRVFFANGYSVFDKTMSLTSPDRLSDGKSIFQKLGLLRRHPINFLLPQKQMVNEMLSYRPDVLYGNRSSLDLMSEELERCGITYPLKLLVGGSEIIYDKHRRQYEKCFKTRFVEYYGTVELGILAFAAPDQDGMILCEDQSYFEFIDEYGKAASPGDESRIIVTDLANTLMPFIRYNQGDKVIHQQAKETGRNDWRRLNKIIGRDNDFVLLSDGRKIQAPVFYKLLSSYKGINQFRVIQKSVDNFEIYLQADAGYICFIEKDLLNRLKEQTNVNCEYLIIRVDQLQPDKNGKSRMLISEVVQS